MALKQYTDNPDSYAAYQAAIAKQANDQKKTPVQTVTTTTTSAQKSPMTQQVDNPDSYAAYQQAVGGTVKGTTTPTQNVGKANLTGGHMSVDNPDSDLAYKNAMSGNYVPPSPTIIPNTTSINPEMGGDIPPIAPVPNITPNTGNIGTAGNSNKVTWTYQGDPESRVASILPQWLQDDPDRYEVDDRGNVWVWNIDRSAKHRLVGDSWLRDWSVNPQAVNGFFNAGTGGSNRNTEYWDNIKALLDAGESIYEVLPMDELVKRGLVAYWPNQENIWNYPELWGMFGYTPPEGYTPNSGLVANGIFTAEDLAVPENSLTWYNLGKNWYEVTGSEDPLAGYYTPGGWYGNQIGTWAPGGVFATGKHGMTFSGLGADLAAQHWGGVNGNNLAMYDIRTGQPITEDTDPQYYITAQDLFYGGANGNTGSVASIMAGANGGYIPNAIGGNTMGGNTIGGVTDLSGLMGGNMSGNISGNITMGGTGNLNGGYYNPNDPYAAARAALLEQQAASQKQIDDAAAEAARQAYINYRTSEKAMPAQLAALGISGGMTETTAADLHNNYLNALAGVQSEASRSKADLDLGIAQGLADLQAQSAQFAWQQQQAAQDQANWEAQFNYQQEQDRLAQQNYERELAMAAQEAARKASTGGSGSPNGDMGGVDSYTYETAKAEMSAASSPRVWLENNKAYMDEATYNLLLREIENSIKANGLIEQMRNSENPFQFVQQIGRDEGYNSEVYNTLYDAYRKMNL